MQLGPLRVLSPRRTGERSIGAIVVRFAAAAACGAQGQQEKRTRRSRSGVGAAGVVAGVVGGGVEVLVVVATVPVLVSLQQRKLHSSFPSRERHI